MHYSDHSHVVYSVPALRVNIIARPNARTPVLCRLHFPSTGGRTVLRACARTTISVVAGKGIGRMGVIAMETLATVFHVRILSRGSKPQFG